MTNYCTLADVKAYLGTDQTTDDAVITPLIGRATTAIETYCGRSFTARAETRHYDAIQDVNGQTLYVDDDLLTVTSITNGDSEVLDAADYVLLPSNVSPKYAIRLKSGSSKSWTYVTDPEEAITIVGSWGYKNDNEPPADVHQAAVQLAAWYYHHRKAPFETTGFPDLGQATTPSSIPVDVRALLAPYLRVRIG